MMCIMVGMPESASINERRKRGEDIAPAVVLAFLRPRELRIVLCPGVGLADFGIPCDIPIDVVPSELRIPNTRLWVRFDENHECVEVWQRER